MRRTTVLLWVLCLLATCILAADDTVVFRSDVALVRVDAQVLDRDNRAISGLRVEDFVLREEGKTQPIRGFAREDMPVDVLLLLDVSTSMKPHIQRINNAAHGAFSVLGKDDRIGIMVFDRTTRTRMALRNDIAGAEQEIDRLLKAERFNGGTDITRAMFAAASYMERDGRKQARRSIVIVTDDQTEFDRDEAGVERALQRADTTLSALIAPDAMSGRMSRGGGGPYPNDPNDPNNYPNSRNGRYPNDPNGRSRGGLGGITLPGGIGFPGGGGYPGGQQRGGGTFPAGTAEIARASGGDSMRVEESYGLETTLSRLRQRYALYFYLPAGARAGDRRQISVELADAAVRRYPDADVRFRRSYLAPEGAVSAGNGSGDPVVVREGPTVADAPADKGGLRRRRVTSGEGRSSGPLTGTPTNDAPATPGVDSGVRDTSVKDPAVRVPTWRRADDPSTDSGGPKPVDGDNSSRGGWRKVKTNEKPAATPEMKPQPQPESR